MTFNPTTVKRISIADYPTMVDAEDYDRLEHNLRYEWWLNHGHAFGVQYGDDGEMQCCMVDFKRMPIEQLRIFVEAKRLESGLKAVAEAKGNQ